MHRTEVAVKSATLPPLRVDQALRESAEAVLQDGESLSGFVLDAVRRNIAYREAANEFLRRGLVARDEAKLSGEYVTAAEMLARLDATLVRQQAARGKAGSSA